MCCHYNHVRRVYCIPTIPQVAYAAGIAIFYAVVKVLAGTHLPRVPSVFHPFCSTPSGRLYYIKHMRQLSIIFVSIIGKNSDFF